MVLLWEYQIWILYNCTSVGRNFHLTKGKKHWTQNLITLVNVPKQMKWKAWRMITDQLCQQYTNECGFSYLDIFS
jgi:hypothetical protein